MAARDRNKVLSLTLKAIDKMSPAMKISVALIRRFRRIGVASLRAIGRAAKAVGRAFKAMLGPLGLITSLFAGLTGFAVARSFLRMAERLDDIAKQATVLQAPVEAIQELGHVAAIAGTDIAVLFKSIQRTADFIGEVQRGTVQFTKDLDRLGLSLEDILGLDPVAQFEAVATAMANMEDNTARLTVGMDIFGARNLRILNIMNRSEEGFAALREEARRLGIVFSRSALAQAEEFVDALARLKTAFTGIKTAIALEFMPILTELFNNMAFWLADNRGKVIEFAQTFRDGMFRAAIAGRAFIDMMRQLIADKDAAQQLGKVIVTLADFVLDVIKETTVTAILIILAALRAILRPMLSVAGTIAEQVGARILKGILVPIAKIPAGIVKALSSGSEALRSTLGDTLFDALTDVMLVQSPGIGAIMATSFAMDDAAIDKAVEESVGKYVDLSEDRIRSAEETIGTIAQDLVAILGDEIATGGATISVLIDSLSTDFDDLMRTFEGMGQDHPAIAGFLQTLSEINARLDQMRAAAAAALADATGGSGQRAPTVVTLDPQAIMRSEELIRASEIRLMVGRAKQTALIEHEFEKRRRSHEDLLLSMQLSQEAFNAFVKAEEVEKTQKLLEINGTFLEGMTRALRDVRENMQTDFQAGAEAITEILGSVEGGFRTLIDGIVSGTKTASESFKDFGRQVLSTIGQIIAKASALKIISVLFGQPGVVSVTPAAKGAVFGGGLKGIQAFANGGVTGSGLSGVVKGPTLALVGEGNKREGVVPLPDGRHIPAIITDNRGQPQNLQVTFEINTIDARGVDELLQDRSGTIEGLIQRAIVSKRSMRETVAAAGR